jgi:hypothetical protein
MKRPTCVLLVPFLLMAAGCGDGDSASTNKGGFGGLGVKPAAMTPGGTTPGVTPGGTTPGGTTPGGTASDLVNSSWYSTGQPQGCYTFLVFEAARWMAGDACGLTDGTIGVELYGGSYTRNGGNLALNIEQTTCPAEVQGGTLNATYTVNGTNISLNVATTPPTTVSMMKGEPPLTGTAVGGCMADDGSFVPAAQN